MKVQALPKIPTQKLTAGERAIGRLTQLDIPADDKTEPRLEIDASRDLAGDLFYNMFKRAPKQRDDIPASRKLNQQLLDWMNESSGFERSRQNTIANIASASAASSLLWQNLTSDEAIADAMAQQELAEKAEQKAKQDQALADAHEAAGNEGAAKIHRERAEHANEVADEHASAASEMLDEIKDDPIASASMAAAAREAAQEAEDISEAMSAFGNGSGVGMGTGSGSNAKHDPKAAMEFLERYTEQIKKIAELAGRIRGMALTAYRERVAVGPIMNRIGLTKDPQKLLPSEWALFRKDVPDILRAEHAARLVTDGLIGWIPDGDAEKQGPFVCMIDDSGSMGIGGRRIVAKAIALGLAQAAKATGRDYIIGSFSYHAEDSKFVTSNDDWVAHLNWATYEIGGGTSFDVAFAQAIEQLEALGAAKQADLMFVSDGEGRVSDETIMRWLSFNKEHGCRVQYVPVGIDARKLERDYSEWFNIMELVDRVLPLDELSADEGTDLAAKAASRW